MAPKWPQVNGGPEHINEHATYLREACNQLQAADKGRSSQIPWNVVQPYIASTISLIGKILQQPSMSEILQQIQDTTKGIQNIQRDITIIRSSVGVSTTPLSTANFSGGRAAATSWAQVAAQAKGYSLPPPPAPQSAHTSKSSPTVTAYKDRVVTVKLKDHGIIQRFRTHSAAWTRQQVETSIHANATSKSVKIVAAHQLKSGDIQIFTSTTTEASQLRKDKGWISGLGDHAELIVPTYGVIVHGISTSSINIKDQKATIQQILADNYTVIPHAEISYVGWLTKESTLKRASSMVVEFIDPEKANAIIYAGMVWDGHIHQCQLYDRACRVKQCFRCYNYGHIGTQCNAAQICGYCAELHETKNCGQKGAEGFTPRCAVCKGAHTAWSNACPARKKEMGRVEQAKQVRSIYWHVPSKEDTTRPRTYNIRNANTTQEVRIRSTNATQESRIPETPIPTQTTTQRPERTSEPKAPATSSSEQINHQTPLSSNRPADQSTVPAPPHIQTPIENQILGETIVIHDSDTPSVGEEWATPETQQELVQQPDPLTDPHTQTTEEFPSLTQVLEDGQFQSSLYPLDGIEGAFTTQDADIWLDNMISSNDTDKMYDAVETAPSPPTSMATDTRTALGKIYKGCRCPSHQEIYSDWPTHDAELTIAQCMKICVYCGKDFPIAAELRKHLKRSEYVQRNLRICQETRGKGSSTTPAWTSRLTHRLDSEPPTHPLGTRAARSQHRTNSANETPRRW